ncbi:meiosis-specific coiled-coil domain-containing protein MEIOC-like isoform X1 [Sinocyclocheilus rhinocerous]|uniref:meiosis-specific coiled-coil domain-containing protein MEIOC-like isoform X1 n=1 Tax=Sinocyclocheilus rhinocerous TaxID=307959 RepID=UPI0007BA373C|nr:PREDICTED: meiosis-specific coiled-coil domain-containing protein MEIOC-like isoform X1 [Sinocyclocheilus rhinocerous]
MEVNNAAKSKINVDTNGARTGFDRFHNTGPDSFFSTNKPQNSFRDGGLMSYNPFLDCPVQDSAPLPYTVWPTQEEDCKSVYWPQVIPNNRNLVDANNCGSEADLYGLVSDILEEPDSMDPYSSYVSENRLPSSLKGVWSPKLTREDRMQYFNNEVQMPPISGFPTKQICPKPVSNISPQPAGRESHQWAELQNCNGFDSFALPCNFSTCNGEANTYSPQDLPRPPGLSTPPALSSSLFQTRPGKPEYITPEKEEGYRSTTNCLSDYINSVNNSCCPPQTMDDSYFSSSHEFSSVSKDKLKDTQSFSVQDVSKLAFLLAEQDMNYCRESTQNGLLGQRNLEEIMAEQKSHAFQRMSELITQTTDFKREVTHNHMEQRGAKVVDKKQSHYTTNEFSRFGPPKTFSPTIMPPALHPNREASLIGSSTAQNSVKQYQLIHSNHYQKQAKISAKTNSNNESQGFAKLTNTSGAVPLLPSQQLFRPAVRVSADLSQGNTVNLHGAIGQVSLEDLRKGAGNVDISDFDLQLENNRLSAGLMVDGCFSPRFSMKPKLPGFLKEADKKTGLLQNPYQGLGSLYGGQMRHNGASSNSAKAIPSQLFPFLYQMGDPRKSTCHLIQSQSQLPYCSVPVIDMNERLPEGDVSPFSPYLQECIGLSQTSGDGSFSGFLSAMTLPKFGKALGNPNSQLHFYLEECYEQWKMLEKERKQAEAVLTKTYPGKRVSVVTSSVLPKMPPNPSRLDRLIVDQLREQARVAGLLGKMEQLRSFPLHANVGSALDRHLEVIYITQARRKDEFINASSRQRQPAAFFREDREILLLASAVKDLCSSTRKARTALWCALQMTLPKTNSYPEERDELGTCSPLGQDSSEQSSLERALTAL